ncbi:MAG: BREX-1 system adenine-specific DNA-methyltransferase PglX, partial [Bacteroidales bacterium]|nr:BREX-1 system adenine-specific DNA-methyltransferase PglX [Bacteroidales bacterium]
MDKSIIENLINEFNIENLTQLFRQKVRTFTPLNETVGQYNDSFFSDCTFVGNFVTPADQLEMLVFAAKVGTDLTERSGKKKQYELGKKVLKDKLRYTGGFFVFYDDRGNFRFSFIYNIPLSTGKVSYSNYRRYTYFVSRTQTNKTFIQQISEADFSSLERIIEAFSVEKVTRQFYQEVACWYFWAMDKIRFPDDYRYADNNAKDTEIRNSTNLIRLLTRLIFIWFLKEKRLVPDKLFDSHELKKLVKDFYTSNSSTNYYNAILQNLFFGTLNQKMDERKFVEEGDFMVNRKTFGVKNLYRYADKFIISPDEAITLFKDVPFLNGGLFDCLDKEGENGQMVYIDGFSRNEKKQAIVPDFLFFQSDEERVNLTDYQMGQGKTVRGLIEILHSYNFTVDESSPVDQEVALDPELLGKVFEELLASYNPETADTARKATGSFYTPREIVDYMVRQSLLQYFKTKTQLDESTLEHLLSYTDDLPHGLSKEEKGQLIELIDQIKILDPACGSGAFPMGILHQLVFLLQKLDPENKHWYELQYNKALAETKEAFKHTDKNEREELLKMINDSFDEKINYPDYARKLYLIENCIYGIDIQPIAVQISKLRFFISLVLDQKIDSSKANYGIRPLPNLETKFVAANTLIGISNSQKQLRNLEIEKLEVQLKELRHQYFTATSRTQKLTYQAKDKQVREQIAQLLIHDGWPDEAAKLIAAFDPYDPNASAPWFDPEWMFGITDGFDIVIGNPPYISTKGVDDEDKKLLEKNFGFADDTYNHFYFKGIALLKQDGILAYISSKTFWTIQTKKNLRVLLLKNKILQIFDTANPFASAMVDTCVMIVQKQEALKNHEIVFLDGR